MQNKWQWGGISLGHQKQTVPEKDCLFLFTQKDI